MAWMPTLPPEEIRNGFLRWELNNYQNIYWLSFVKSLFEKAPEVSGQIPIAQRRIERTRKMVMNMDSVPPLGIKKTIRFAEAPVKGMSVLKYDPDGTAAHAYRQLAKEVLSHANR